MSVAIDQQFKSGKKGILEQRVPTLHESNTQEHYFVSYIPVPTNEKDFALIEQWTERMTFIIEDLTWLLQQDHAQFWCQASFNKDFRSLFDSYLRYAPRVQLSVPMPNYSFVPNGQHLENEVSQLIFLCVVRLSTHEESTEHFFTPKGYADTIYTHYIFDIPRLFDICSLYAVNNREPLSKSIGNIFKQQTRYCDDLRGALHSIQGLIQEIMKNFNTQGGQKKVQSNKKNLSISELDDLLHYLLDISSTLNRFFSVYPSGRAIVFQESFHLTLMEFFETFLRIYQRTNESKGIADDAEIYEETKYETVNLIEGFIRFCCVEPLNVKQDKSEEIEELMKIFSAFLSAKRSLAAYQDYFDLLDLLEFFQSSVNIFDEKEMKYYRDGIRQSIELYGTPSCKQRFNSSTNVASASNLPQVKKSSNSKVETIRDLFPHLEQNYIEICLKHYNNDADRLVGALFDNSVPESLLAESTRIERAAVTTTETKVSTGDERQNIFGENQFDVFNQENIALGLVHRGKKTRDDPADLNDKTHLNELRDKYRQLSLVESSTDGEYDDEYDDTYDDGIVNVQDQDDPIDKDLPKNENRLLGVQPRRFRQIIDDDEENPEENGSPVNKARDAFVENPEVVRERRAQQRAAMQQRRETHQNRGPAAEREVVGNARGRGQTANVLKNRRWKDEHKSSVGNHDRRYRAAQKANRGLLS